MRKAGKNLERQEYDSDGGGQGPLGFHKNKNRDVVSPVKTLAEGWLCELKPQQPLQQENTQIVKLYGAETRRRELHIGPIEATSLAETGVWRQIDSDMFAADLNDARRILWGISSALQYMHSLIVHNDVKPAKVLYSRDSSSRDPVLCDFGLSTTVGDPPSNGGTPWYIAPEYLASKQRGPPSDIWALAVTMLYPVGATILPDVLSNRHHPRHTDWIIADINRSHPSASAPAAEVDSSYTASGTQSAANKFSAWLIEVNQMTYDPNLNVDDDHRDLITLMLEPDPSKRVTAEELLTRFSLLLNVSQYHCRYIAIVETAHRRLSRDTNPDTLNTPTHRKTYTIGAPPSENALLLQAHPDLDIPAFYSP
ncbi:kinase-like domain-containing protein [Apodospora peruviana]|uniref:Kinase-like domain-containing protein n=1 Tax=Apodospora peruviana TaxID=516989 RepID=A0AAE0LYN7_9PEZI|nr:kinase-like domain-containing protein [Apodospora peruviana]